MIENIKLFAKIGAKSAFKWLTIIVIGMLATLIFMTIVAVRIDRPSSGGPFGGIGSIFGLVSTNIFAFLIIVGFPIFLVLYYICANKMAVETATYETWKNKAESYVRETAEAIIEKVAGNQKVDKITSAGMVRLKLLDAVRQSSGSKIKKRVLSYAFKKMRLDTIDFAADEVKLSNVLSQNFTNFISERTEPSWLFFWILLLGHSAIFIVALIVG